MNDTTISADPSNTSNASDAFNATSEVAAIAPSDGLARPQLGRRRRWAHVLLASAFLAQGTALYFALSRSPETRVITRVEHSKTTEVLAIPMAPQLVQVPVATASATAEARACPTPRTDAPRIEPPSLDEDVDDFVVSPTNAGWIAAWNHEHIFVSTDAGRTFRRTLDGVGDVRDVAFDCFGRVLAVREEMLGISDGGRDMWRSVPGLELDSEKDGEMWWPAKVRLIGGGRDVIVVGQATGAGDAHARVAVSRDLGASWSYRDLTSYAESSEDIGGFQRADGSIVVGVEVPDCMSDDLAWVEIRPDGTSDEHWISMPGAQFEFYGDQIYTAYARRKLDAPVDAEWTRFPDEQVSGTPIQAPYPVVVSSEKAARMVGSTAKILPWVIEGEQHAMDPAGRLWSIVCGQLWIASTRPSGRECAPEGA